MGARKIGNLLVEYGGRPMAAPTFRFINYKHMSLRTSAHTGVAIRFQAFPWEGGAPRSELKSNNCQWQLHNSV